MTDIPTNDPNAALKQDNIKVQNAKDAPQVTVTAGKDSATVVQNQATQKTLKKLSQSAEKSKSDSAAKEGRPREVPAKVTQHSRSNPREYTARTSQGDVTLRTPNANVPRPAIADVVTVTVKPAPPQQNAQQGSGAQDANVQVKLSSAQPDAAKYNIPKTLSLALTEANTQSLQQLFTGLNVDLKMLHTVFPQALFQSSVQALTNSAASPLVSNTGLSLIKAFLPALHPQNVASKALIPPLLQISAAPIAGKAVQANLLQHNFTSNVVVNGAGSAPITQNSTLMPSLSQAVVVGNDGLMSPRLPQGGAQPLVLNSAVKAGGHVMQAVPMLHNKTQQTHLLLTKVAAPSVPSPQSMNFTAPAYGGQAATTAQGASFLTYAPFMDGAAMAEPMLLQVTPTTHGGAGQNAARIIPSVPSGVAAMSVLGPVMWSAESWPAMQQLFTHLLQVAPQQAAHLQAVTPSPVQSPQSMMPAIAFFLTAIKGGDFNSWLGDKTIDILKKTGKGQLLKSLQDEGSALNRLRGEHAGEWRTHALPLHHDGEFHKILLHIHGDEGQDGQNQGDKTTRFLFDLSLDRIGDLQLDGFYGAQKLDLIVRTKTAFSADIQHHLKQLYAGALGSSQVTGQLSFQSEPKQWVQVMPIFSQHLTRDA